MACIGWQRIDRVASATPEPSHSTVATRRTVDPACPVPAL